MSGRRRIPRYSDAKMLVSASSKHSGTTHMVTPSPEATRQTPWQIGIGQGARRSTVAGSEPRQLFPRGGVTFTPSSPSIRRRRIALPLHTSTAKPSTAPRKELFSPPNSDETSKTTSVACSSAPRIPAAWLLQQAGTSTLSSKPPSPEDLPNRHGKKKTPSQPEISKRRAVSAVASPNRRVGISSMDSLASVGPLERKSPSRKMLTKKRPLVKSPPKVSPRLNSHTARTTNGGLIPSDLVGLLIPKPLQGGVRPRTTTEVLDEVAAERQSSLAQMESSRRKRLPRTCKAQTQTQNRYAEDSDVEDQPTPEPPFVQTRQDPQPQNPEPWVQALPAEQAPVHQVPSRLESKQDVLVQPQNGGSVSGSVVLDLYRRPSESTENEAVSPNDEDQSLTPPPPLEEESTMQPSTRSELTSVASSKNKNKRKRSVVKPRTVGAVHKQLLRNKRRLRARQKSRRPKKHRQAVKEGQATAKRSFRKGSKRDEGNQEELIQSDSDEMEVTEEDNKSYTSAISSKVRVVVDSPRKKTKKSSEKRKSKVRFAPLPTTTTTFSVKIRVQTSSSPQRKGKKGILMPPQQQLSKDAVQSITNQITQACLNQAGNVVVNNGDGEGIAEGSTNSDDDESAKSSPDATYDDGDEVESNTRIEKQHTRKKTARQGRRKRISRRPSENAGKKREKSRGPVIDARSVMSEISRISMDHAISSDRESSNEVPHNDIDEDSTSNTSFGAEEPEDENPADSFANDGMSLGNASVHSMSGPRHGSRKCRGGSGEETPSVRMQKVAPPKRKRSRRTMACSDSLAGLSFTSKPEDVVASKVPKTVSLTLKHPPARLRSSKKVPVEKHSGRHHSDSVVRKQKATRLKRGPHENDETVVTNRSTDSVCSRWTQKSYTSDGRCGECTGCQQEYDCLKCDACFRRMAAVDESECEERVCKMRQRHKHMESLGSFLESWNTKATKPEDDLISIGLASMAKEEEEEEASVRSRKKRLSGSSELLRQHQLEHKRRLAAQRRASSTASIPSTTASKGKGRGRKRKKNPLHDMKLPLPKDGSFETFMEGRRVFRAIMEYDEADQDWV